MPIRMTLRQREAYGATCAVENAVVMRIIAIKSMTRKRPPRSWAIRCGDVDGSRSFAASVRRFSPRLLLSELLLKQWFEPVVPFTVMIGLWAYFALTIPDYASVQNSVSLLRLFAEFGLRRARDGLPPRHRRY